MSIFFCEIRVNGHTMEDPSTTGTSVAEYHLYGSSAQGRFATWKPENISYTVAINPPDESFNVSRTISQKGTQVKDHLGNVRANVGNGLKLIISF